MDSFVSFVSVVVALIVTIIASVAECGPLNEYILDYQPLVYDRSSVHSGHQRVKRSADTHLYVRFSAYGRNFHLKLSPSKGVFGEGHQVLTDGVGLRPVDTSFIYQGQVKGEPRSSVHLAIHNGSMEGEVHLPETTYHIEPAAKYIKTPSFHTIIYPETHLDTDPFKDRRQAEASSCGVDHFEIKQFMENASRLENPPDSYELKKNMWSERGERPHNIYTEYSNRKKRASGSQKSLGAKNACPLHVRADPLLFDYFKNKKHGQEVSDSQAEEEILAFFSNHVNAISTIYSNTLFQTKNGELQNSGLKFVIHRSTIMKDCQSRDAGYCKNSLFVSNYLDLTSNEDHDQYCLAVTFTYRDFTKGTLGLAWVATEVGVNAGVCGRYQTYTTGGKKSLNTGIVTIINFGRTIPNRVSQLTLAHELGHNFGSPHDTESEECAPFGTTRSDANQGNYIMFPSATSGDKPNNDKFSPCSKDIMTRIIQQVVDEVRYPCFIESGQAFCGNMITEGNEECDCGFGTCAPETCCEGRIEGNSNSGCKLKGSNQCSPDSGPCCSNTCLFITQSASDPGCEDATDCKIKSVCDFKCPTPVHRPNGTFCNEYSKTCISGECLGPVCSNIVDPDGLWEECFLTTTSGAAKSELCYVACRNPRSQTCISSTNSKALEEADNLPFKLMLMNVTEQKASAAGQSPGSSPLPIELPPGSACDNFRGYCDTFSKCEHIDAQGPFSLLKDMIFDPVTLKKIEDWIVEYWWAVLLMCIGLVVFMGVFIKIFGYNTPSQNPKVRQRERAAQRAQPQQSRQQQRPRNTQHQGRSGASAPPPYTTEMDMAHYNRNYQQGKPYQFDRVAPGYGKNHI